MIIDVRTYRIKPGRRAEFIRLFETRSVGAMREHGMQVLGSLTLCETTPGCVFGIGRQAAG